MKLYAERPLRDVFRRVAAYTRSIFKAESRFSTLRYFRYENVTVKNTGGKTIKTRAETRFEARRLADHRYQILKVVDRSHNHRGAMDRNRREEAVLTFNNKSLFSKEDALNILSNLQNSVEAELRNAVCDRRQPFMPLYFKRQQQKVTMQ